MASGNLLKVQYAKESAYDGHPVPTMTHALKVFSEGFKYKPGKKEEGLLTGTRSKGKFDTLSKSAEATLSLLMRPDDGFLLAMALGVEADAPELVGLSTGAYKHTLTALGTTGYLPSAAFTIDRIIAAYAYTGIVTNSFSFSAAPEDYLKLDLNMVGRQEKTGTIAPAVLPSPLKAFKFKQAVVKLGGEIAANVTNIKFDYNNNLVANLMTTSTGEFFAQPDVGPREITADIEVVYSTAANTLRNTYFVQEQDCSLEISFTSDQEIEEDFPYSLTIIVPAMQVTECSPNVGGPDLIKQSLSLSAFENGTDELITIEIVDSRSTKY